MHAAAMIINLLLKAYILLIFVWVLASWFPQWRYQGWFRTVDNLVRPYMDLFRGLPLRVGMIDLTPMAAIFVVYLFQYLFLTAVQGGLR